MNYNAMIYHHNDPDGHVSGYLAENFLLGKEVNLKKEGFVYKNVFTAEKTYTSSFDDHLKIEGDDPIELWFVDLSFTQSTIDILINAIISDPRVKRVVWIDHHASSKPIIDGVFSFLAQHKNISYGAIIHSNNACGAVLTYIYTDLICSSSINIHDNHYLLVNDVTLKENEPNHITKVSATVADYGEFTIPNFLYYLDHHDRWTRQEPEAPDFITGYMASDFSMTRMDQNTRETKYSDVFNLFDRCEEFIRDGKKINEFERNRYFTESKFCTTMNLFGHRIIVKNGHGNSKNFLNYLDDNLVSFAVLYRFDPESRLWIHSIYANKSITIEVNKIAEQFGGGGHAGAAGFQIEKPIFTMKPNELADWIFINKPAVSSYLMATPRYKNTDL